MKRSTHSIVGTVLRREASTKGVGADVDVEGGDQCDLTWFWLPNRKKTATVYFMRNGGRGYISGLFKFSC